MKRLKLPFEIGLDYEDFEFDLEIFEIDKIPNYDSYLYLGEVKKFLNFISVKTELIFYWDRLEIVILTFENMNDFEEFKNILNLPFQIYRGNNNYKILQCTRDNLKLLLIRKKFNTFTFVYGNSTAVDKIYKIS